MADHTMGISHGIYITKHQEFLLFVDSFYGKYFTWKKFGSLVEKVVTVTCTNIQSKNHYYNILY